MNSKTIARLKQYGEKPLKKHGKRHKRGKIQSGNYTMLTLIFSLACTSGKATITYDGQNLRAIDMHLHTGEWTGISSDSQSFLAGNFPFPFNLNPEGLVEDTLSAEGVIKEMNKAGLDKGILFAVYAPRSVGVTTNEFVMSQTPHNPKRLYGLASLSVENWETEGEAELQRLREALSDPQMVGVKLAHTHMHFRMDDPAYYSIYTVAGEAGKPVYVHTGPSPFEGTKTDEPYINPNYLEHAISTHPDTRFILGHLGFDFEVREHRWLDDCIRLAKTHENVYLEPSALGSKTSDPTGAVLLESYTKIRENGVIDRVIYGSDGPQSPGFLNTYLQNSITAMTDSAYTADEVQAVLSGNAEKLFNIEPSTEQ